MCRNNSYGLKRTSSSLPWSKSKNISLHCNQIEKKKKYSQVMDRNTQVTTKQLVKSPHKGVNLQHAIYSAVVSAMQAFTLVDFR